MTKTKIICTLGPATSTAENIKLLIKSGMDMVRLNFSHGNHQYHLQMINLVKEIRQKSKKNIGILQDLCGPKIRVGNLPKEGLILKDNDKVVLYAGQDIRGDHNIQEMPINYNNLLNDIEKNAVIMLDDGLIELLVEKKSKNALFARIVHGGILYSKKGVNFPNQNISARAPTQKDIKDLEFGLKNGVDFIALSFVQDEQDILNLKKEIDKRKADVSIIAKIERGIALKNLDKILTVSDGVMVARGDLGIETEIAMIPIYQQLIIKKCNLNGIPVITATQMLDSMIRNPIPTRAEVTDVANAIYNGSDAIMLSGETAIGEYPVETTMMMREVADNVENNIGLDRSWIKKDDTTIKNQRVSYC